MERRGAAARDLSALMGRVGDVVAIAARPLARRKSGRMAGSIRPGRAKLRARVMAGGAALPYVGPQHYGWARRGITPNPFLLDALDRRRSQVLAAFNAELKQLTR